MRPRRTPQTDIVFRLRGGTEDNDLWVEWTEDGNGRRAMVSVWDLNDDERARIAAGGTIELMLWGSGHPPVSLAVGASLEERQG